MALKRTKSAETDQPLIGAHLSAAGGVASVFDRARKLSINTFQFFAKNNHQWFATPLREEEISEFLAQKKAWNPAAPIVAHACYLLNFGSGNEEIRDKTERSYFEELKRADSLGVDFLVFHPGNRTGIGEETALANVVKTLDVMHAKTPEVKTLSVIEITAGQGSSIGCTFEQLAFVLDHVRDKRRMGVCLDTCHMFAAGYDIRTQESWETTMNRFDSLIGFDCLKVIHTNDSKKGLGCRVDRHEHIGKGEIGTEAFRLLMTDPRLRKIPKILETPKDAEMTEDFVNLKLLRKLAAG